MSEISFVFVPDPNAGKSKEQIEKERNERFAEALCDYAQGGTYEQRCKRAATEQGESDD